MKIFWHKVCRWVTNCFSSTHLDPLHKEACLPPLPLLIKHRQRLAALRLLCSPPEINPATACLPATVQTYSSHPSSALARGKIPGKPYLFFHLPWDQPQDKIRRPRYRHSAITALAHTALPLLGGVSTLPPISLHLTDYLPPTPPIVPSYQNLKSRAKNLLLAEWTSSPTPGYYRYRPTLTPHPFMGLGKFIAGRLHQMRSGKSYLAAHSSWQNPNPDPTCPNCLAAPQTLEHSILACASTSVQRSRLLQGISSVGPDAPLWSDQQSLLGLAEYIRTTATGFPPGMPPLAPSILPPTYDILLLPRTESPC